MFERQIDEHALDRRQALIPARCNHALRRGQRPRIGGECARITAKHVAWKLVEHDDQGEQTARFHLP